MKRLRGTRTVQSFSSEDFTIKLFQFSRFIRRCYGCSGLSNVVGLRVCTRRNGVQIVTTARPGNWNINEVFSSHSIFIFRQVMFYPAFSILFSAEKKTNFLCRFGLLGLTLLWVSCCGYTWRVSVLINFPYSYDSNCRNVANCGNGLKVLSCNGSIKRHGEIYGRQHGLN